MDGTGGGDGGGGSFGGGDFASSTPATDSSAATSTPADTGSTSSGADVVPIIVVTNTQTDPRSLLTRALDAIQFRKKAKLDKIVAFAAQRRSIQNDDVQKLLRVSDATATRYLAELVKQGRLKMVGNPKNARYEPQ